MPWATHVSHEYVSSLDAEVAVLHVQDRLHDSGCGLAVNVHAPALTVESRVRQLVGQAMSEEVLAGQPPRWRAWL
jgi:hypothetical protein